MIILHISSEWQWSHFFFDLIFFTICFCSTFLFLSLVLRTMPGGAQSLLLSLWHEPLLLVFGSYLNKLRARQALFLPYSLSSQISSFWLVSCRDRGQSLNWLWSAALLLKGQQLLFNITIPLECLVAFKTAWAFPFISQGSNEQPGVRFWKGAENRPA